jgi:hypothetical protein
MNNQGKANKHTQQVTVMKYSTCSFFHEQISREDGPTETSIFQHEDWPPLRLLRGFDLHSTPWEVCSLGGLTSTPPPERFALQASYWEDGPLHNPLREITYNLLSERIDLPFTPRERIDLHSNPWEDWPPHQSLRKLTTHGKDLPPLQS